MNHVRPRIIDLNLFELKYYRFIVSLDKLSRRYNAANDLSKKKCVSSKTKDVNLKCLM